MAEPRPRYAGPDQDVILTGEGNGFRTQASASKKFAGLHLSEENWGVIPWEGGFAIVRKSSGVYQSITAALESASAAASGKPSTNGGNGSNGDAHADHEDEEGTHLAPDEKFYRIKFHAMRDENDTRDVTLIVNSDVLVIQRERPLVLPERFIECARNGNHPIFRQVPGEKRKIVGRRQTYPFDILEGGEPPTRDEYELMRQEGTELVKAQIDRDESA